MLTRRHIEQLNTPQKEAKNSVPLAATVTTLAAALVLFVIGFLLLSSVLTGAALAAVALLGGGAFIAFRRRQNARPRPVELRYGLMDAATAARLSRVEKAFEVLVASERIWSVERHEDGSVEVKPVEIGVSDPQGVSTDVDVWSIHTGGSPTDFLP